MTDPETLARLKRLERDRDALHDRLNRLEQRPAATGPHTPLSDLETRLSALESALGITEAP